MPSKKSSADAVAAMLEDDPLTAQLEAMETGLSPVRPAASEQRAPSPPLPPPSPSPPSAATSPSPPSTLNTSQDLKVLMDDSEMGTADDGDDEFGLVETALAPNLRPVLRRCDEVLDEVPDTVHVSEITSEQRRALGRVEIATVSPPRTDIVTDFVKLEVEENELEDPGEVGDMNWSPSREDDGGDGDAGGDADVGAVSGSGKGSGGGGSRSVSSAARGGSDATYGRPYKTTAGDRRARLSGFSPTRGSPRGRPHSRGRARGRAAVAPPSRGRGAVSSASSRGRGSVTSPSSRGRGAVTSPSSRGRGSVTSPSSRGRGVLMSPSRGRGRARGRGATPSLARGRAVAVRGGSTPGVKYLTSGRSPATSGGPIPVLQLADKALSVSVVRDRLSIKHTDESDNRPALTQEDLSFMELVKIKEAVTKKVMLANQSGPEDYLARLRTARRQSIAWVEARLRAEAQGEMMSQHGKQGKSKYDMKSVPLASKPLPPGVMSSDTPLSRGRAILPKPAPGSGRLLGPRHVTVEGQPPPVLVQDDDDPDFDPAATDDFDDERNRKQKAASQSASQPQALLVNANVKNPKTSRDLVILQAKLRDLQNVGSELRRAVDYFSMEATKDQGKIHRLKTESASLEKKFKDLETNILGNTPDMLIGLLDKDKRKLLSAHDDAVLECGELLAEVGRDNYNFVIAQGLPLLSAKELEEKTRGIAMSWQLGPEELHAAAQPPEPLTGRGRGRGGGRGRKKRRHIGDPGAAVDAAVEAVVAGTVPAELGAADGTAIVGTVDGGEHISLPQEVLEQVMTGKGYLVDENGERLEIRVVGDGPSVVGQ